MTVRPYRARLGCLALAASMTMLSSGCAISAMTPVPANYDVETAPSCTQSSGSIGLDVIWGLIWGVPTVAAFSNDEAGLGLLFALATGIHVASAVTGVKWGNKCKEARKKHDSWLTDQQELLRQQRRANRLLKSGKAARPAAAPAPAAPAADPPVATATAKPAPSAAPARPRAASPQPVPARTAVPAVAPARVPAKPRPVRPRNHDPWAEFWREVAQ